MIVISAQAFPPRVGGIQNLLAGTARGLAEAGYDILVLADGGKDARRWSSENDLPYAVEWFSGPRPLRRYQKARRVKALVQQGTIEALYTDTWKSLELLPSALPFPVITWAHGNEFPNVGNKVTRIKGAMAKADHILFNSGETRDRARAFTPADVPHSIVNPPIFLPREPSQADADTAAAIWQDHTPRLLCTCRLIDWKGIDRAISAMPCVLAAYPGAKLAIAGTGDDRERLQALAESLNLGQSVAFLGWIEETTKTALQRSADLFLQPGRQVVEEREGYGITYVEAALQGLPTICGNAGGAPEAVIDGETGLVVDATDPETVAEAILSILGDEKRHAAMRDASRAHGNACLWRNRIRDLLAPAGLAPKGDAAL